jgi:RNA polymerase sigma-70 factor, ECF subfamily
MTEQAKMEDATMAGRGWELALMPNQFSDEVAIEVDADIDPQADLIRRAQAGERAAFDQLMELHQHRVVTLAWRLLGTREDASDAAQEAFLRVFRHLHKYDARYEFNGWLYRIVVNVCRDLQRQRGRHGGLSLDEAAVAQLASGDDSEADALAAQERALLQRALAALSEKERAAIVLRDLEGLPTKEVARLLGSSPTTVRSQISAARQKLKAVHERWQKGRK